MKLTTEELREIRERCGAATPGPWHCGDGGEDVFHSSETSLIDRIAVTNDHEYIENDNYATDATFIAHARTDMPRLLDAYEALEKENERLCEALRYADRAAKYGIDYDAEYVANTLKGGARDAVDSE